MNTPALLLTAKEVAALVPVHVQTFHRWVKAGYGPVGTLLGPRMRYAPEDVHAWMESRRQVA